MDRKYIVRFPESIDGHRTVLRAQNRTRQSTHGWAHNTRISRSAHHSPALPVSSESLHVTRSPSQDSPPSDACPAVPGQRERSGLLASIGGVFYRPRLHTSEGFSKRKARILMEAVEVEQPVTGIESFWDLFYNFSLSMG